MTDILPDGATTQENKVGRPTVMTDEVLAILREGFLRGYDDEEACLSANINPSSLYRYCEDHKDFASEKEQLKKNPILKAKYTLLKGIERDPKLALDYLRSKKRDEFSTRNELTGKDGEKLEAQPVLVKFVGLPNGEDNRNTN